MLIQSTGGTPPGPGQQYPVPAEVRQPAPPQPQYVQASPGTINQPPAPAGGRVTINLDEMEREGGHPLPIDVVLGGHTFVLSDPKALDWKDAIDAVTDVYSFFRYTIPPDQHELFFRMNLPIWKLENLMKRYRQHYGMPEPGESRALPR